METIDWNLAYASGNKVAVYFDNSPNVCCIENGVSAGNNSPFLTFS